MCDRRRLSRVFHDEPIDKIAQHPSDAPSQRVADDVVHIEGSERKRIHPKKACELGCFDKACARKRQQEGDGQLEFEQCFRNETERHEEHDIEYELENRSYSIFGDVVYEVERIQDRLYTVGDSRPGVARWKRIECEADKADRVEDSRIYREDGAEGEPSVAAIQCKQKWQRQEQREQGPHKNGDTEAVAESGQVVVNHG